MPNFRVIGCVGTAEGRRTHTHTYSLSSLYSRFNKKQIFLGVFYVSKVLQKLKFLNQNYIFLFSASLDGKCTLRQNQLVSQICELTKFPCSSSDYSMLHAILNRILKRTTIVYNNEMFNRCENIYFYQIALEHSYIHYV
jgi:hypothetical protein